MRLLSQAKLCKKYGPKSMFGSVGNCDNCFTHSNVWCPSNGYRVMIIEQHPSLIMKTFERLVMGFFSWSTQVLLDISDISAICLQKQQICRRCSFSLLQHHTLQMHPTILFVDFVDCTATITHPWAQSLRSGFWKQQSHVISNGRCIHHQSTRKRRKWWQSSIYHRLHRCNSTAAIESNLMSAITMCVGTVSSREEEVAMHYQDCWESHWLQSVIPWRPVHWQDKEASTQKSSLTCFFCY